MPLDVGVVQEPVDSCGGQALGHDRVEAGRVQVGGHHQISLSDFGTVSLRWLARSGNHEPSHRRDHIGGLETGVLLSDSPEFCCPSARSLLSAYREYELSALTEPP